MDNPTKELCHKLDERGIEYVSIGGITNWEHAEYDELADGSDTRLIVYGATPEQAIAATVGRSCASCPEMDNPDSYIMHLHRALEVADRGAGTIEKAAERIEVLSGFAREYLHRYGMLMSMAGEDVTDEVLAMESVINEVCGRKVVDE